MNTKNYAAIAAATLAAFILSFFFVAIALDAAAGCGHSYTDAKGKMHWGATNDECILVKHEEK